MALTVLLRELAAAVFFFFAGVLDFEAEAPAVADFLVPERVPDDLDWALVVVDLLLLVEVLPAAEALELPELDDAEVLPAVVVPEVAVLVAADFVARVDVFEVVPFAEVFVFAVLAAGFTAFADVAERDEAADFITLLDFAAVDFPDFDAVAFEAAGDFGDFIEAEELEEVAAEMEGPELDAAEPDFVEMLETTAFPARLAARFAVLAVADLSDPLPAPVDLFPAELFAELLLPVLFRAAVLAAAAEALEAFAADFLVAELFVVEVLDAEFVGVVV